MDHFEALAASSSVSFATWLTGSVLRVVLAGVIHEQAAGQARAEAAGVDADIARR
jgi:hypothetical protein